MQTVQIKFRSAEEKTWQGGILVAEGLEDAYVICGCCGGIFEMDDVDEMVIFSDWVDVSSEIMGN